MACAPKHVYVSNEDSGDVSVLDAETLKLVSTISVGKRPRGMRMSGDGRYLMVAVTGSAKPEPGVELPAADRGADGIVLVDVQTRRVVRSLHGGDGPESFDLSPDGQRLYVSNEDSAQLSVIDMPTETIIASVLVGAKPEGVAVRPDGGVVYVTSEEDGHVYVVDTVELKVVHKVQVGPRPRGVVFSKDGDRAYVSAETGSVVTVVDGRAHAPVGEIRLSTKASRPVGLALLDDGVCIATGRGGAVECVEGDERTVVRDVGARPWGIAIDGDRLYTANGPSNDVSVIDLSKGRVVGRASVGRSPWGVLVGR